MNRVKLAAEEGVDVWPFGLSLAEASKKKAKTESASIATTCMAFSVFMRVYCSVSTKENKTQFVLNRRD